MEANMHTMSMVVLLSKKEGMEESERRGRWHTFREFLMCFEAIGDGRGGIANAKTNIALAKSKKV
jgi:hypothetical protein